MDRTEAKLLLQACRPNGQDSTLPVFAEALALAERDPELKAWWTAQQAFDQKVTAKLQGVPMPEDLRRTILAGRKIERTTPRFHLPYWLAAAAAIILFIGIGWHYSPGRARTETAFANQDYDASVRQFLQKEPDLGLVTHDHAEVLAWLQQRQAPTGNFPGPMVSLPTLGCQQLTMHGHTVSLICFSLADGDVAHLFIIEKDALSDPPGTSPHFDQNGSWSSAAWSDNSKSYLLLTQAGPDRLKNLL